MREKEGYREQLALITERITEAFPASLGMLTVEQAAAFLQCDVKTVRRAITRRVNPLAAVNIGMGKRKQYRIAITTLARFSLG